MAGRLAAACLGRPELLWAQGSLFCTLAIEYRVLPHNDCPASAQEGIASCLHSFVRPLTRWDPCLAHPPNPSLFPLLFRHTQWPGLPVGGFRAFASPFLCLVCSLLCFWNVFLSKVLRDLDRLLQLIPVPLPQPLP